MRVWPRRQKPSRRNDRQFWPFYQIIASIVIYFGSRYFNFWWLVVITTNTSDIIKYHCRTNATCSYLTKSSAHLKKTGFLQPEVHVVPSNFQFKNVWGHVPRPPLYDRRPRALILMANDYIWLLNTEEKAKSNAISCIALKKQWRCSSDTCKISSIFSFPYFFVSGMTVVWKSLNSSDKICSH